MDEWKKKEFYYADRLRKINAKERKKLYFEAYTSVSKLVSQKFKSKKPENRTAGTSEHLVKQLSYMVTNGDNVLEIGCGRGYTCLKLAPHVMSIVGIEVSDPSIIEATEVLSNNKIKNVTIKKVSAFELTDNFSENEFDVCISIDVVEHLHPDDAKEHLQQVFHILKPGGKYIICMPNRLSGPHDITKKEFPKSKKALGFHLKEWTYSEIADIMKAIGFNKFQVFYPSKIFRKDENPFILSYEFSILIESLFKMLPKLFRKSKLKGLISIKLIAYKTKIK